MRKPYSGTILASTDCSVLDAEITSMVQSAAVIRMIAELADGAVKLLGKHDANEGMRQGQRTQRPARCCRTLQQAAGARPSGPPIRNARSWPFMRQFESWCREVLAAPGFAATIQGNDMDAQAGIAANVAVPSSAIARARSRPLPRTPSANLDEFQRQLMRQPLDVFVVTLGDPHRRHALADRNQSRAHALPGGESVGVAARHVIADGPQTLQAIELADTRRSITCTMMSPQIDEVPIRPRACPRRPAAARRLSWQRSRLHRRWI